ncbi:UNVERIFIED_CONTAM: hypothetical protein Sindi_2420300 [Sesamum indicum]
MTVSPPADHRREVVMSPLPPQIPVVSLDLNSPKMPSVTAGTTIVTAAAVFVLAATVFVPAVAIATATSPLLPTPTPLAAGAANTEGGDDKFRLPSSSPTEIFVVAATSNGFFFFQFKTVVVMEEVIEEDRGCFKDNQLCYKNGTRWPVVLGDLSTRMRSLEHARLDFARVCVMLDVNSKLPKHLIIMSPTEEGGGIAGKVNVEYEWLPLKCTTCMSLGHATKDCLTTKPPKPPVNVYVPQVWPPAVLAAPPPTEQFSTAATLVMEVADCTASILRENRGKKIIVYNTFDALMLLEDEVEEISRVLTNAAPLQVIHVERSCLNVRGLNKRDHQLAVTNIVEEFKLPP